MHWCVLVDCVVTFSLVWTDAVLWLSLFLYWLSRSRCSGRQKTPDAHFRAAPRAKHSALSTSGHTSGCGTMSERQREENIRQGDIVKQLAHKEVGLPLSILCFIVFSSCNLHHEHHSVETCDWDDKLFYWSHRGSEQQVDSSWPFCSVPVCCVWNTPCWPLDRMQV